MRRASAISIGLLAAAAAFAGPSPAAEPPLPLDCRILHDGPWGEIYVRNAGTVTIPHASRIGWQTSSGRHDTFELQGDLPPGHQYGDSTSFRTEQPRDDNAGCTAQVAWHPPLPPKVNALKVQPLKKLLDAPTKGQAVDPGCQFCDPPLDGGSAHAEKGPGLFQSGQTAANPASQRFEPPQAPGGQPLYACETLDSDSCGRPVADQFCRQHGFARAAGFDTDKRKGPVATLAGETCTRKKCKAFDFILCAK